MASKDYIIELLGPNGVIRKYFLRPIDSGIAADEVPQNTHSHISAREQAAQRQAEDLAAGEGTGWTVRVAREATPTNIAAFRADDELMADRTAGTPKQPFNQLFIEAEGPQNVLNQLRGAGAGITWTPEGYGTTFAQPPDPVSAAAVTAAADQPGKPFLKEDMLPSVALQRALANIGWGEGIPRALGARAMGPVQTLWDIGSRLGGIEREGMTGMRDIWGVAPEAEGGIPLPQDAAYQNFLQRILPSATGQGPYGDPTVQQRARDIFFMDPATTQDQNLNRFFQPRIGLPAMKETSNVPVAQTSGLEGMSGTDAALALASLARIAAGRRFGALGGSVPTSQALLTGWGAQPTGPGMQGDYRQYLIDRLGIS